MFNVTACSVEKITHSSGDGAWVMRKCALTLGGECFIDFQPERTIFALRCPATPFEVAIPTPQTKAKNSGMNYDES